MTPPASACYASNMSHSRPPAPTDYELYLRVPELLTLQKPPEARACPDELLFQVVHQAAELWMKLIDHEISEVARALDADSPVQAATTLTRVHKIQQVLSAGIEPLYTLSPADYMRIRAVLGRGSGQESPGFRRLLALGGDLWPHFARALERRGAALIDLYRSPALHPDLYAVAEGLLEFDLRLQEWRNRHILLVYRTIGVGTPSLKGKHSELLERGLRTQFFPALWEVRDAIYKDWTEAHPQGAASTLTQNAAGAPQGTPPAPSTGSREQGPQ